MGRRSRPPWTAEELLTGAVEVSVMLSFLQSAERQGLRPLFYQSSAEGRVVLEASGAERLADLIVRPRVGVRDEREAALADGIFELLPQHCHLSLMLKALPRIEPIIELWPATGDEARPPAAPGDGAAAMAPTPG